MLKGYRRKARLLFFLIALLPDCGVAFAEVGKGVPDADYVDVHMHLAGMRQKSREAGHREVRDSKPQKKEYGPAVDEIISVMDHLGVEKAVVMPPPQIKGQKARNFYREFTGTIERYRGRLFFAGGGDILNPMIMGIKPSQVNAAMQKEFRERAIQILKDGAVGFGEMTALHFSFSPTHAFEEASPDHPLFLLLADIAAEYQVPIDLHMEAVPADQKLPPKLAKRSSENPAQIKANIAAFERLLKHNPVASIVWQHVGWDNTGHMTVELVRRLLKDHPNLYCALKFVKKEYEPFQLGEGLMDKDMKIRPSWLALIEEFPDRFMVGADDFISAPGSRGAGPPSFSDTWALVEQLPEDLRNKVGRENAERVYRLVSEEKI